MAATSPHILSAWSAQLLGVTCLISTSVEEESSTEDCYSGL